MTSFFGELRRRNVVRVAVAYAIVGWILVEVSSTVFPVLQIPDWAIALVTMLLILGFPVALILSWAYDLTPQGIVRADQVPLSEGVTKVTGRKFDFVIIGLLVLAVGYMFVDNYLPETGPFAGAEIDPASLEVQLDEPPSTAAEPTPAVAEEQPREVLPNSVAVLVCANLSPDPDDAYFAASIHDEILNQLFKIRALNVIARTSVLQYADAPPPISQIAEELNVQAVMECTVRYAGDAILVTAQLIDPETNIHLWSDTYPGDLSDLTTIFAMQADIAMNIANAVGAEFSVEEQTSIEKIPTESRAAYVLYLRATANILSLGNPTTLPETRRAVLSDLDRAIELDPQFALAYARRAWAYVQLLIEPYNGGDWLNRKAELEQLTSQNASRALELDPQLGVAWAALGQMHMYSWRQAEAHQAFERAMELSPNEHEVLFWSTRFYWHREERLAENYRLVQRVLELGPNSSSSYYLLGMYHRVAGNYQAAVEAFSRDAELAPEEAASAYLHRGMSKIALGDNESAAEDFRLAEQLTPEESVVLFWAQLGWCYGQAGQADDAQRILLKLQTIEATTYVSPGAWAWAYLGVRDDIRALRELRKAIENPDLLQISYSMELIKQNFSLDPILDQPEWLEVRSRLGFRE